MLYPPLKLQNEVSLEKTFFRDLYGVLQIFATIFNIASYFLKKFMKKFLNGLGFDGS
ncbi:MAG: hypothetical protein QG560_686 [Campylobacterota bacterium]|nr:hypothetical protein [Campylobacterota bacterium]